MSFAKSVKSECGFRCVFVACLCVCCCAAEFELCAANDWLRDTCTTYRKVNDSSETMCWIPNGLSIGCYCCWTLPSDARHTMCGKLVPNKNFAPHLIDNAWSVCVCVCVVWMIEVMLCLCECVSVPCARQSQMETKEWACELEQREIEKWMERESKKWK